MENLIVQMRDDLSTESKASKKSENEIVDPVSSNNPALGVFKVEPDLYVLHVTAAEIESLAGVGTSMILIDEEWIRAELNEECGAIPFLESGGQYWGPPSDDDIAIRELERLRRAGAKFAIVVWPAFWWLDYYTAFHAHLRANYPVVLTNERIIAFDLRSGG